MKHKTNFLRDRKKRTGDEEWSVMEEKGGNRDNTRAQSLLFVCGKSPSLLDRVLGSISFGLLQKRWRRLSSALKRTKRGGFSKRTECSGSQAVP